MARIDDRWRRKDGTRTGMDGRGSRWQAVWTEGARERKKSFKTRSEAQDHVVLVGHQQRTGSYVSAAQSRVRIRELLPAWEASLIHLKPSTRAAVRSDVRASIEPFWGECILADIARADVQQWVAGMDKAPRTVDTIYGRLHAFMTWCVAEGRLATNPAAGVNLPKGRAREHQFLTAEQVKRLSDAAGPVYGRFILFLATTGLRIGEAAELRVRDVNLGRRRIAVARSVVFVQGSAVIGSPKSGKSRSVPLTAAVSSQIAELIQGKDRDELVFTTLRGHQIRANNFKRRDFNAAVKAAREAGASLPADLRVHDLRHTAASLAVTSGASVKSVQRMLGHSNAAVTLDVYAGLFDQELDDVALRMDDLFAADR